MRRTAMSAGSPASTMCSRSTVTAATGLSLDPADGWSAPDTATLAGYAIYAAGNVKIAVDQDIAVAVA